MMEEKRRGYIEGIVYGIWTLITGLKVTFVEFFTKKTTQKYPENRDTLVIFDRYRGTLTMLRDEAGNNKCTACGLCVTNCPNSTINIESEIITDEETGKKKKVLVKFQYNLGSCMFCMLCVNACPSCAIAFDTTFEHAVYNKAKLTKTMNNK